MHLTKLAEYPTQKVHKGKLMLLPYFHVRALRSDYACVRAMIRDGTCAPHFSNLYDLLVRESRLFTASIPSCGRWSAVDRVCDWFVLRVCVCDCRGEGRPYPRPVWRLLGQDWKASWKRWLLFLPPLLPAVPISIPSFVFSLSADLTIPRVHQFIDWFN